ncbi:MAG: protein O-mannosyl-transferase family [Bacteroidota bacterium]
MPRFSFEQLNKILGWLVFAIALVTYWLTVEPTVSFWDPGEYISTSSKLQVGHPPGAPFYQIVGAFFSLFAADETQIALMVNLMSVFSSAFAILFLFWSITLIMKKIIPNVAKCTKSKQAAVLASSFIGALTFTFTDSFWFSAVEAEVYAMAACIMAAMFYLGLLWERDMHQPRGHRWVILIALLVGLSFGVHFMGLLTIPAIGFLYYFKNTKKITPKNFILANLIVVGVLMFIFKLLLPYTMTFFAEMELFFVNTVRLPFNSGTIIAGILVVAAFYALLKYTRQKKYYQLNTLVLCVLFILIGFSSWIMLPIRANAGTVINENNPSSAQELLAYYNREQYPETKLFYGPQFTDMFSGLDAENPYSDDKPKYEKDEEKGKYVIVNDYKNAKQNPSSEHKTILPRMWSNEHAHNYLMYTGTLDFTIKREYQGQQELVQAVNQIQTGFKTGEIDRDQYISYLREFSQYLNIEKPSYSSNLTYLFEYQFGYMYWRYFMWNFSGRQNDKQGKLNDLDGNWISGIPFIDEMRLGNQSEITTDAKTNPARNAYFMLPFILGIIGLLFHLQREQKTFWVLTVLFLFTGIALKIYLNERPFEPRERDYALVGSFYVFAIWIGIGVYALFDLLKKYISPKIALPIVFIACLVGVPALMASENWDDHDRSNRYTALAMAKKYLDSVDEDAILFTIGDNDTFALWYAQEIEGYRRDVRTINTSLFATDWYIDQMRRKAYKSEPIKTTLEHKDYSYGTNDFIFYQEDNRLGDTLDIKKWMKYIKSDNQSTKAELQSGQVINTYPTKHIRIPVDKETVLKNGIVKEEDADKIVSHIDLKINENMLSKNRILMLDLLANNNWDRPIYFTGGSFSDSDYLWLKDYLQLDGVTYQLVPIKSEVNPRNPYDMGRIDTDKMYDIVTNWSWGNSGSPEIYHDPETRKNSITYRGNMARLVENLIAENDFERAEEILDLGMEKMPVEYFEYYTLLEPFVSGYYEIEKKEKARVIWKDVTKKYQELLTYYASLDKSRQNLYVEEIVTAIERYRAFVDLAIIYENESYSKEKADEFNDYINLFEHFFGGAETDETNEALFKELEEEDIQEVDKEEHETSLDMDELTDE